MRRPNNTASQTFGKANQDKKVVHSLKRLYILIRKSLTHVSFLGFKNMSSIPLIRVILLSVTGCLSFVANSRGETMRFWFRLRRPLTVTLAQKLWPRAKNLVGFVLFVDEAGFEGRCSHSSRWGKWSFLAQFYKITSPYCQPYPSHCNNVTSKSHIDINWTLINEWLQNKGCLVLV